MKNGPGLLAALALVIIIGLMSVFTVDERDLAVKFKYGEIIETDFKPGLHWMIPIVNNIQKYPRQILTLNNPQEQFLTKEKKNVLVDFFVKFPPTVTVLPVTVVAVVTLKSPRIGSGKRLVKVTAPEALVISRFWKWFASVRSIKTDWLPLPFNITRNVPDGTKWSSWLWKAVVKFPPTCNLPAVSNPVSCPLLKFAFPVTVSVPAAFCIFSTPPDTKRVCVCTF